MHRTAAAGTGAGTGSPARARAALRAGTAAALTCVPLLAAGAALAASHPYDGEDSGPGLTVLQTVGMAIQQIREDRILHEALATGGDVRRLCDLFGISVAAALRYTAVLDPPGLAGRTALLRGDWTAGLDEDGFDLAVANPPYVRSGDIETLDPEVRDYEPRLALDGGEDGLDAYRRLAPEILRVLKPGGLFLVEIGHDQAEAVKSLFAAAGAVDIRLTQDLAGHDRIVAGSKKPLGIAPNNR